MHRLAASSPIQVKRRWERGRSSMDGYCGGVGALEAASRPPDGKLIAAVRWWGWKCVTAAAAVIAIAPFVVPALVVFSAVSLAVAVPLGVCLASIAFAKRVMSYILPFPRLPKEDLNEEEEDELESTVDAVVDKVDSRGLIDEIAIEGTGQEKDGIRVSHEGEEEEMEDGKEDELQWKNGFVFKEIRFESKGISDQVEVFNKVVVLNQGSKTEISSSSSEYASALEDRASEAIEFESEISTEINPVAVVTPLEEFERRKKIWEQLQSLRIVMGYKAPLHSSILDELRALYIFTGIAPPASPKDDFRIEELENMLRFLKNLVGVR